jgi:hypothetical protein
VNNSSNEEMSIGGQITAILKLEYPSMVKVGPKKTTTYAKTWSHYSITRDEDRMTAADRFREEFWVSEVVQTYFIFLFSFVVFMSIGVHGLNFLFCNAEYLFSE